MVEVAHFQSEISGHQIQQAHKSLGYSLPYSSERHCNSTSIINSSRILLYSYNLWVGWEIVVFLMFSFTAGNHSEL